MVEKVDRYVAKGGREFVSEESAHRHEAVEAMIAAIPELALIRPRLEASMNAICQPVAKLARFLAENHPDKSGETTPKPCCVNTPRGQDHHTDCPKYQDMVQADCNCVAQGRHSRFHHRTCPVYRAAFPTGLQIAQSVGIARG